MFEMNFDFEILRADCTILITMSPGARTGICAANPCKWNFQSAESNLLTKHNWHINHFVFYLLATNYSVVTVAVV